MKNAFIAKTNLLVSGQEPEFSGAIGRFHPRL